MTEHHLEVQLSLNVEAHPNARQRDDDGVGWIEGTLVVGGKLAVPRDLQPGERLTVRIADADGQLVATGELDVEQVAFPPIKAGGMIVGTERQHKAKVAR